ncbi:72 kDa inositol polyphosphate 5-phosphatase [Seminavis robusta]|uniref:72 kDa inositol polyphosphate 5-phosphatase n=1 Tax=Seminavis robusta TaxID=568900 RepID=A0A9N8EL68_9STRA|nr:72 kDa inositol polyphosphate 5-phosphatase [Seminavis robusta]|eukprot:Sro1296_g260340.1 72 kDa inositol polyphosphate 5-phosphatase (1176) ;mRNA; r:6325-10098
MMMNGSGGMSLRLWSFQRLFKLVLPLSFLLSHRPTCAASWFQFWTVPAVSFSNRRRAFLFGNNNNLVENNFVENNKHTRILQDGLIGSKSTNKNAMVVVDLCSPWLCLRGGGADDREDVSSRRHHGSARRRSKKSSRHHKQHHHHRPKSSKRRRRKSRQDEMAEDGSDSSDISSRPSKKSKRKKRKRRSATTKDTVATRRPAFVARDREPAAADPPSLRPKGVKGVRPRNSSFVRETTGTVQAALGKKRKKKKKRKQHSSSKQKGARKAAFVNQDDYDDDDDVTRDSAASIHESPSVVSGTDEDEDDIDDGTSKSASRKKRKKRRKKKARGSKKAGLSSIAPKTRMDTVPEKSPVLEASSEPPKSHKLGFKQEVTSTEKCPTELPPKKSHKLGSKKRKKTKKKKRKKQKISPDVVLATTTTTATVPSLVDESTSGDDTVNTQVAALPEEKEVPPQPKVDSSGVEDGSEEEDDDEGSVVLETPTSKVDANITSARDMEEQEESTKPTGKLETEEPPAKSTSPPQTTTTDTADDNSEIQSDTNDKEGIAAINSQADPSSPARQKGLPTKEEESDQAIVDADDESVDDDDDDEEEDTEEDSTVDAGNEKLKSVEDSGAEDEDEIGDSEEDGNNEIDAASDVKQEEASTTKAIIDEEDEDLDIPIKVDGVDVTIHINREKVSVHLDSTDDAVSTPAEEDQSKGDTTENVPDRTIPNVEVGSTNETSPETKVGNDDLTNTTKVVGEQSAVTKPNDNSVAGETPRNKTVSQKDTFAGHSAEKSDGGAVEESKPGLSEASQDADESSQTAAVAGTKDLSSILDCPASDSDMNVSIVTWNLAESSPSEDEATFIRRFRGSDLVLVSGQECENIKPRRSEGHRSREFRRLMIKMLGKKYVPLGLHLLGGIQFGLFCKRSILKKIEFVSIADVTCGIGNVFHNKGAIGAFVQVKASKAGNGAKDAVKRAKSLKMLFVTAHMAAHVKNAEARNADFWRIVQELEAQAPPRFLTPNDEAENEYSSGKLGGSGSYLLDSMDRVFFCGDLNYRINLPREEAEHTVEQMKSNPKEADKLRERLLRHDQLLATMAECNAFAGLCEGKITFLPTFKFDKGTDEYDTSHKQRIPAWTDRVVFKPTGTRIVEYDSAPEAMHSDHRPVFASFRVSTVGSVLSKPPKRKRRPRRDP